jgi:hypothetical protein
MIANTGGPAFPLHNHGAQTIGLDVTGMSLRDYFAAKAMHGYLSDYEWHSVVSPQGTAEAAYRMADEMLKAKSR